MNYERWRDAATETLQRWRLSHQLGALAAHATQGLWRSGARNQASLTQSFMSRRKTAAADDPFCNQTDTISFAAHRDEFNIVSYTLKKQTEYPVMLEEFPQYVRDSIALEAKKTDTHPLWLPNEEDWGIPDASDDDATALLHCALLTRADTTQYLFSSDGTLDDYQLVHSYGVNGEPAHSSSYSLGESLSNYREIIQYTDASLADTVPAIRSPITEEVIATEPSGIDAEIVNASNEQYYGNLIDTSAYINDTHLSEALVLTRSLRGKLPRRHVS